MDDTGVLMKEPISILDRRIVNRGGRAATEILVHWRNTFPEDVTWEVFSMNYSRDVVREVLYELQQRNL